jgi:hypothetical protein
MGFPDPPPPSFHTGLCTYLDEIAYVLNARTDREVHILRDLSNPVRSRLASPACSDRSSIKFRRAELYIIKRLNTINLDPLIFSGQKSQNNLLLPHNAVFLLYLWKKLEKLGRFPGVWQQ